ncbi:hypothetical protein [Pectobacterium brasiliense]|uniref:hypothetical protein n=1 Tax=Pectobacterium brasiliense TaxID=180957 RepID=UPI00057E002D|nr:hypothetical protein [Pectobacterium brasiliense]KHT17224.1 hypothetical protein RC97_15020 [Pectobacterium brasiliense]
MLEKLELTKNVQFYTVKNYNHLQPVNENIILDIFNAADDNIEPEQDYILNIFRDVSTFIDNDIQYRYSIKIFPTIRPVYFIRKEEGEEGLYDRIYAFIIIFEFDGHICIIKKSCANISDKLEMNFDLITSTMIADTFNDSDVSFQRISMRNMTISDKAIRNRSYEAADLKGTFSTHAAGRSIPLFLKYRQGSIVRTISGTGRLVESSHRVNFDNLALWAYNQLLLIKNGGGEKDFLDAFAKQKILQDVLAVTSPNAILIESSSLYDQLIEDSIQIKYVNNKGNDIALDASQMNILFKYLERVYTINPDKRIEKVLGKAFIRVNNKTLTFDSSFLRSLKVNISGSDVTLQSYIIKNGFYSITFNDPRYMYFIGNCFQDDSGISEINSILDMLTPVQNMNLVKSEKGSFRRNSANFSRDSMFFLVESKHKYDDYIFCDDLGTEWADHITFNKKDSCINFIHSKHGTQSTSASKLHDVIGQAVKNLGYLNFSQSDFIKKIHDKLSSNYNSSNGPTQIKRTRKGNITVFDSYMTEMLKDYKLHRKCILSCSFISKVAITTEFKKIQRGEKVNGHITQLLWILSSFSHAVKETNAIPLIYCED